MEERRRMDTELAGLKELIMQRFNGTDERLEALTNQVATTNGRLQKAETQVAVLQDRLYLSAGAILLMSAVFLAELALGFMK